MESNLLKGKKLLPLILIIVFFISSLQGCSFFQKRYEKTETREFKISSAGKTKIILENKNGNIIVRKNSSDSMILLNAEIKVNVTKKELNEPLKNFEISIDTSSNEIRISNKTTYREEEFLNFGNWHNNGINYTLYLPNGLDADISSTNGKLEASDISNNITGSTVNGKISFVNTSGLLKLETTNGKISAELDSTRGMTLDVVNGSINLKLSPSFSGIFHVDWVNGSFKYDDFNFQDVNKDKKFFKGKIGNSGSEIKISTVNGSIKLYKK